VVPGKPSEWARCPPVFQAIVAQLVRQSREDVQVTTDPDITPSERDLRDADVAAVLARAFREGEIEAPDALRIIKHEMRRRNTNIKLKIETRSVEAQAVIEKCRIDNLPIPKNDSPDALHADHVYPFTADVLRAVKTAADWVHELDRLRTVVCVTAAENYELEKIERDGTTGPEKYKKARITWAPSTQTQLIPVEQIALPNAEDETA
jgi:hypothetical protein